MDLWVVAVAAGAGYLTKHWQNVFRDKESLSEFHSGSSALPQSSVPRSFMQENTDKSFPTGKLSPRRTTNECLFENGNENENYSDCTMAQKSRACRLGTTEVTSTSSFDHGKQVEKHNGGNNMPYNSSVFPSEFGKYEIYEYESGYRSGCGVTEIPENHIRETGVSYSPRRSKNSLRNRCLPLQFIKHRSSLDSCLLAQMHRELGETEDYILNPLASPCTPTLRPLLVTDGRRLIGRASRDFRDRLHLESHSNTSYGMVGIPYLPQTVTDYAKMKLGRGKNQTSNDRTLVQLDSRDGSPGGQFIFCLGISIGIIYTIIAQKLEVEKLKESLKQSENLVQDLQEELEMKDSLTVKELVIDDSSQEAEPMSKIEAELEAELERLELSMSGTSLRGKISNVIEHEHEFDGDTVAKLVHGELRADVLRRKSTSEPTSTALTPLSANYTVSPHELCLRLHEVLESRLQHQILELEEELTKTQKKVYHLESERVNYWREIWNSESSSNPSTPVIIEAHSPVAQPPLVMNLSGDALDAYNEAFEQLSNLKVTRKDDQLETYRVLNGKQNDNRDFDMIMSEITAMPKQSYDDDDDDDEDLLLIRQIVEMAKQGSPAVLRAQRVYLENGE